VKPHRVRRLAWTLVLLAASAGCGDRVPAVSRVILVTFDTTRADRLGCYGYELAETPTLDRLADEGVLFEQAVSPVPTTLPSHSTMFTGIYPQDHGVRYNIFYRLSEKAWTLAEVLQDAGFVTAAFPASRIVSRPFGLNQGFDTWVDPPKNSEESGEAHPVGTMRPAGEGVDLTLDWLAEHPDERSFVWLHFYDPHWPYTPPFPFSSRFRDRPYDGEIAYADAQLGRLIQQLEHDGRWDDTLVVVVGDHGEGLYDHNERYHSTLVYETTQHVPLIVKAPGITSGRVSEPVSLVDIMPTILDLADVPVPEGLRGISLRDAVEGGEIPRRDIYFEVLSGAINYGWSELFGVRYGAWKLIDSNEPELYDLENDPGETRNLVDHEPERLADLREALDVIGEPIALEFAGSAEILTLDPETEAALSSLGYVAGGAGSSRNADARHPRHFTELEPEILAGQGAVARGEFDAVEDTCRYVLSRDPTNMWALNVLRRALVELDRPEEALAPARRLIELVPDSDRFHANLAGVLRILGRHAEVEAALEEGLARIPDSEQLRYLRLVAAFDRGQPTVCGAMIDDAISRHPESARVAVLEARCRARAGERELALAALERAVEHGFHRLELIEGDDDFKRIVNSDAYRRIAEAVRASREDETADE